MNSTLVLWKWNGIWVLDTAWNKSEDQSGEMSSSIGGNEWESSWFHFHFVKLWIFVAVRELACP